MFKNTFHNRKLLEIIFILAILVSAIVTNPLVAKENSVPFSGNWAVEVPNVGKIALSCDRPRSDYDCELFWIFKKIPVKVKTLNNEMRLHTDVNAQEYISVYLHKNIGPDNFLESNIITSEYFNHYSKLYFKKLKPGGYSDITDFRRSGNEVEKYHERGTLKKLPAELPDWIINPSAYLFKNKNKGGINSHRFNRILEHPNISKSTLEDMYHFILNDESSTKSGLQIIARHPNTSIEILTSLFNEPPKPKYFNYISLLKNIAENPKAPAEYKQRYIDTIKEGNYKIWNLALRNPDTSADLIGWIARQKDLKNIDHSRLYSHPNLDPETIDYLFERPTNHDNLESLARHNNSSNKILIKLAQKEYKYVHDEGMILELISKSKSEEAAQIALLRMSKSKNHQISVAENERIPKQIIDDLINSPSISLRRKLAENKALTYNDLMVLAKDKYTVVAKVARSQLNSRFANEYNIISTSLKPLSSLNPAYSISHELQLAIPTNDVELVKSIIKKYREIQKPPYHINIDKVLKGDNKELQKILLEVTPPKPTTQEKLEDIAEVLPALILIFGAAVIVLIIIAKDFFIPRKNKTSKPYFKWFIVFTLSMYQVGCWSALEGFNGAFGSHSSTPHIPIFIIIVIIWAVTQLFTENEKDSA